MDPLVFSGQIPGMVILLVLNGLTFSLILKKNTSDFMATEDKSDFFHIPLSVEARAEF